MVMLPKKPEKKPHSVKVSAEHSCFEVLSGRSGKTYRVYPLSDGSGTRCVSAEDMMPCEGHRRNGTCSHAKAAMDFAAELTAKLKQDS